MSLVRHQGHGSHVLVRPQREPLGQLEACSRSDGSRRSCGRGVSPPAKPPPAVPVGAEILGSGRRVKGLPEVTARRAAHDAAAASWTLGSRGGQLRTAPAACRVSLADPRGSEAWGRPPGRALRWHRPQCPAPGAQLPFRLEVERLAGEVEQRRGALACCRICGDNGIRLIKVHHVRHRVGSLLNAVSGWTPLVDRPIGHAAGT